MTAVPARAKPDPPMLTFVLRQDTLDGGWWVEVLEAPGCFSQGESVTETLRNAAEAYELWSFVAAAKAYLVEEEA